MYIDLGNELGSYDYNYSSVSTWGGPNQFHYNAGYGWSSAYYRWQASSGGSAYTTTLDNPSILAPLLNQKQGLDATGIPLDWTNSNGNNNNGLTSVVYNNDGSEVTTSSLKVLRIELVATQTTSSYSPPVTLEFGAFNSLPVSISLAGASSASWPIVLPNMSVFDGVINGQATWHTLENLKARVVNVGSNTALEVARFDANGSIISTMTGKEVTSLIQALTLIDNNPTPHEAAYSFRVSVSPDESTWVSGNPNFGQADTTTVFYDSVAPAPGALYAAGNNLFLAMNGGTQLGMDHGPSNTTGDWQNGINLNSIIPAIQVTVDGYAVGVNNITSAWNGYTIELASPVQTGKTVQLTYTPPSGSVGVDQLNGVFQDQAMNDAAAFTVRSAAVAASGMVINETSIGFTNASDDYIGRYFGTRDFPAEYASGVTLVSYNASTGAAVIKFHFDYVASGNPLLNGYTMAKAGGGNYAYIKAESELGMTLSSSPFTNGYFSGNGSYLSFSSLAGGVDEFFSSVGPRITSIAYQVSRAIGADSSAGSGASSAVVVQSINSSGASSRIWADDVDNTAQFFGNDTFTTGAGNDTLIGGAGNDLFMPGTGYDIIDGGDGLDTLDYSSLQSAISLGLQSTTSQTPGGATGANLGAAIYGIENVVGTSFNDNLFGNEVANVLDGGSGDDSLRGGGGSDTLIGSLGNDTAYFSGSYSDYTFSVGSDRITVMGPDGYDVVLASVERIIFDSSPNTQINVASSVSLGMLITTAPGTIYGTNNNDALLGTEGADTLFGFAGNDSLAGAGGNDILLGGDGSDSLAGDNGDDTLIGGAGTDYLDGGTNGSEGDVAFYVMPGAASSTANLTTSGITLTSDLYRNLVLSGGDTDRLTNVETVVATSYNDNLNAQNSSMQIGLVGLAGNDTLVGGSADDMLVGGSGNDTLIGGAGADFMMGGVGDDVYYVDNTGDFVKENPTHVDYANNNASVIDPTWFASDPMSTGMVYDSQVGASSLQLLGGGTDTVRTTLNSFSLSPQSSQNQAGDTSGLLGDVENLEFIGSGNFVGTGNALNNTIVGGAGNDTLFGGLGTDTLIGGVGNDSYRIVVGDGSNTTITDTAGVNTLLISRASGVNNPYFGQAQKDSAGKVMLEVYNDNLSTTKLSVDVLSSNFSANGTQISFDSNNDGISESTTYTVVSGSTGLSFQNNFLFGTAGNDTLAGNVLDDFIEAGSGNDAILATAGYDKLNGGLGTDSVTYSYLDNLSPGVKGIMVVADSYSDNHFKNYNVIKVDDYSLINAQSLISAYQVDQLSAVDNILGTIQSDVFIGGGADDYFSGRGGLDTFYGGSGSDWVDYQNSVFTVGITANLSGFTPVTTTQQSPLVLAGYSLGAQTNLFAGYVQTQMGPDKLYGIEGISGTNYADTLIGSTASDWLRGNAGNDVLIGVGNGLPGHMVNNTSDWADYRNASGSVSVNLGVNVDASQALSASMLAGQSIVGAAYGTATGADGTDTLIGIQGVRGSAFNDVLVGSQGNDWLAGGLGNDTLNGGGGSDTASYKWASGSVAVNLQTGSATGADGADTLIGIERVVGSRFSDTLIGSDGNDIFRPLDGADTVDGGLGSDWIAYREAASGVSVDLSGPVDGNGYVSVYAMDGIETTLNIDKLKNIENVVGSAYSDTLIGNAADNTFQGMKGSDIIDGGAGSDTADYKWSEGAVTVTLTDVAETGSTATGSLKGSATGADGTDQLWSIENIRGSEFADTLIGNAQNNIIAGGAGNDTLSGGAGSDTVSYSDALGGVTVNLAGSTQTSSGPANESDVISGFENIIGSAFDDVLTAYSGGSLIDAGAGNDSLLGGAGNDTLRGGLGNDFIDGAAGSSDLALFGGSYANYTVTVNQFSNSGNVAGVTLVGADGTDIVTAATEYVQFDVMNGANAAQPVLLDVAQSVRYGTAVFINAPVSGSVTPGVPNASTVVTGTSNNDVLLGTSANQTLIGYAGNDVLDGAGGVDTLIGGAGNDSYVVYSYKDKVVENINAGTDTIQAKVSYFLAPNVENLSMVYANNNLSYLGLGNNLNNSMLGGGGVDVLYGRDGNDILMGLAGNDKLYGGSGNDTIFGGDGNDFLYGNAGVDSLYGGAGDDTLDAGAGSGVLLVGGVGNDTYIVNDAAFLNGGRVVEGNNEGHDTVVTTISNFVLPENVEGLQLVGAAGNATGNAADNFIVGNLGANTINGGAGSDVLIGDSYGYQSDVEVGGSNDYLMGGEGNDLLYGQAGNDVLDGGNGDDTMYGGIGDDIYYVDSRQDVVFDAANLASGSIINTGGVDWIYATASVDMTETISANQLKYQNVENIRLLDSASPYFSETNNIANPYTWDYLSATGTADANILEGNRYDNFLSGLAGNDTLIAGAGDDVLNGGVGNDYLDGGAQGFSDVVLFGATARANANDSWTQGVYGYNLATTIANHSSNNGVGVKVNLDNTTQLAVAARSATGSDNVNSGTDVLINIESVVGTNFDDVIIGNASDNMLMGGLGNDTMVGGAGNDILAIGAMSAYGLTVDMSAFRVGTGSNVTVVSLDFSKYQTQATALVIDLAGYSTVSNAYFSSVLPASFAQNGLGVVTAWGFEGLGLSELADTLYGTSGNDQVFGFGGSDLMFGGAGNDTLYGDGPVSGLLAGNDSLSHDTIFGGLGDDKLIAGSGASTLFGESGNDQLYGAYGNDYLLGGDGNDLMRGAEGADTLNGGLGSDTIYGDAGDDILIGGPGNDALYGGLGDDEYLYTGTENIVENANEGAADKVLVVGGPGYTLGANIEVAALAEPAGYGGLYTTATYLNGNALDNVLLGNVSDNTLSGGLGNDVLAGYGGLDTLIGGAGNDIFALTLDPTHSLDPATLNGFGGMITDFNRQGENDKLLLNFVTGGTGSTPYHYQLNVGYGSSYINGSSAADGSAEAMITYDASNGLLQIEFQKQVSGVWTWDASHNSNLSFVVTGSNDSAPAMITANSFLVDTSMDMTHPMDTSTTYWGASHYS